MIKLKSRISSAVSIHLFVIEILASHIFILTSTIAIEVNVVNSLSIAFRIIGDTCFRPIVVKLSSVTRSIRLRIFRAPFPVLADSSFPHIFLADTLTIFVSVSVIVIAVNRSWMEVGLFVGSGEGKNNAKRKYK